MRPLFPPLDAFQSMLISKDSYLRSVPTDSRTQPSTFHDPVPWPLYPCHPVRLRPSNRSSQPAAFSASVRAFIPSHGVAAGAARATCPAARNPARVNDAQEALAL